MDELYHGGDENTNRPLRLSDLRRRGREQQALHSVRNSVNKRLVLGGLLWAVGATASMTLEGWVVGIPLVAAAGYLLLCET